MKSWIFISDKIFLRTLGEKFCQYLVVFKPRPVPAHWLPSKNRKLEGKMEKKEKLRKCWKEMLNKLKCSCCLWAWPFPADWVASKIACFSNWQRRGQQRGQCLGMWRFFTRKLWKVTFKKNSGDSLQEKSVQSFFSLEKVEILYEKKRMIEGWQLTSAASIVARKRMKIATQTNHKR